jgi:3-(3-hydroxy-phenyl)propionate hydroxylase
MLQTHQNPVYEYRHSADQDAAQPVHHPLIIVGAGPIGMGAALDAAQQGMRALVLDDNNTVSVGSRAVCYSKRALEILDRLGCGERMVEKGVTWNVGKVFFQDELVNQFDLLPQPGHKIPAFINLQQYYLEEYMVERMDELDDIEVRWKNKVVGVENSTERVEIEVQTPDGNYRLSCDYLIVADGANSGVRTLLGLESSGKVFQDRFLIADIVMKADFPPERWFNFDPSWHRGQSALLHRQPDNVWRLDFQLGWDKDPAAEKKPENIIPRVKAMLGDDVEFELEWASVYTFQCRRMPRFRQGRVLFAGDAAHQVSPFGARGANSGLQDTDNLLWKLRLVMEGKAPDKLLDSYCDEREFAADENIMNSTRSTDFITPKSKVSLNFRNAALELSRHYDFARKLVNSGRLSDPAVLHDSWLNTQDEAGFDSDLVPGAVLSDAPVQGGGFHWLLNALGGGFKLLYFVDKASDLSAGIINVFDSLKLQPITVETIVIARHPGTLSEITLLHDDEKKVSERCDATPDSCYLIRPDQHVAARWRELDLDKIIAAVARATAQTEG